MLLSLFVAVCVSVYLRAVPVVGVVGDLIHLNIFVADAAAVPADIVLGCSCCCCCGVLIVVAIVAFWWW